MTNVELSQQARTILEFTSALMDTVRQAGHMGVPCGHLYAATMSVLSLEQYQKFEALLLKTGKVRKSGHCLYYVE